MEPTVTPTPTPTSALASTPETPVTPVSSGKKIAMIVLVVVIVAISAIYGSTFFKGSFIGADFKKDIEAADFSLIINRPIISVDGLDGTLTYTGTRAAASLNGGAANGINGTFSIVGNREPKDDPELQKLTTQYKTFLDQFSPNTIATTKTNLQNKITAFDTFITSTLTTGSAETDPVKLAAFTAQKTSLESLQVVSQALLGNFNEFNALDGDATAGYVAKVKNYISGTDNFAKEKANLVAAAGLASTVMPSLASEPTYIDLVAALTSVTDTEGALPKVLAVLTKNNGALPTYPESIQGTFIISADGSNVTVKTTAHNFAGKNDVESSTFSLEAKQGAVEQITSTPVDATTLAEDFPMKEFFSAAALSDFYKKLYIGQTALSYHSIFTETATHLMKTDSSNMCSDTPAQANSIDFKVGDVAFSSCFYTKAVAPATSGFTTINFKGTGINNSTYSLGILNPKYGASTSSVNISAYTPAQSVALHPKFIDKNEQLVMPQMFLVNELPTNNLVTRTLSIQKKFDSSWVTVDTMASPPNGELCVGTDPAKCPIAFNYPQDNIAKFFTGEYAFEKGKLHEYRLKMKITLDGEPKEKDETDNEKLFSVPVNFYTDKQDQGLLAFPLDGKIPVPFKSNLAVHQPVSIPLTLYLDSPDTVLYSTTLELKKDSAAFPATITLPADITKSVSAKLAVSGKHSLKMIINEDPKNLGKMPVDTADFFDDNIATYDITLGGKNAFTKLPYKGETGVDQVVLDESSYHKDKVTGDITHIIVAKKAEQKDGKEVAPTVPLFTGADGAKNIYLGVTIPDAQGKILYSSCDVASIDKGDLDTRLHYVDSKYTYSNFSLEYTDALKSALISSNNHFDVVFNDSCVKTKPFVPEDNFFDNKQHYYLTPLAKIKISAIGENQVFVQPVPPSASAKISISNVIKNSENALLDLSLATVVKLPASKDTKTDSVTFEAEFDVKDNVLTDDEITKSSIMARLYFPLNGSALKVSLIDSQKISLKKGDTKIKISMPVLMSKITPFLIDANLVDSSKIGKTHALIMSVNLDSVTSKFDVAEGDVTAAGDNLQIYRLEKEVAIAGGSPVTGAGGGGAAGTSLSTVVKIAGVTEAAPDQGKYVKVAYSAKPLADAATMKTVVSVVSKLDSKTRVVATFVEKNAKKDANYLYEAVLLPYEIQSGDTVVVTLDGSADGTAIYTATVPVKVPDAPPVDGDKVSPLKVQATVTSAKRASDGSVTLTHALKNIDTKDVAADSVILQNIHLDDSKDFILSRPWNYSKNVSLRAGESLTYTTVIPKEKIGAGAKTLMIDLFELTKGKKLHIENLPGNSDHKAAIK